MGYLRKSHSYYEPDEWIGFVESHQQMIDENIPSLEESLIPYLTWKGLVKDGLTMDNESILAIKQDVLANEDEDTFYERSCDRIEEYHECNGDDESLSWVHECFDDVICDIIQEAMERRNIEWMLSWVN